MPNPNSQQAIVAILEVLDVPLDIDSKDGRLRMQKSIYLSQLAGLNLGYSFNWYINGPYSSALADDYYEAKRGVDEDSVKQFKRIVEPKLNEIKAILETPPGKSAVSWAEAVGSLAYAARLRGSLQAALEFCIAQKGHLETILPDAKARLEQSSLFN
jgi:hypothetical protein